jgi:hypothetical protein
VIVGKFYGARMTSIHPPDDPGTYRALLHNPEFLRLPKSGTVCPWSGLTRSYINGLILPTEANAHNPPVKSVCLRQRGAKRGVRLVSYDSLMGYLRANLDEAKVEADGAMDVNAEATK